jgi:hypothetical protein
LATRILDNYPRENIEGGMASDDTPVPGGLSNFHIVESTSKPLSPKT